MSKIKEAMLCLAAGRVTLPYPAEPHPAPVAFRGAPVWEPSKCTGCAGCANNCPARAILVNDICQEIRVLKYVGRRCTYCGRCAEVCTEKAITMSSQFESATNAAPDLEDRLELFMSTCQRCGRCFEPPSALEQLKLKGYRRDDLEQERWVFWSRAYCEADKTTDDVEIEMD